MVKLRIQYVATDGRAFHTKDAAQAHETGKRRKKRRPNLVVHQGWWCYRRQFHGVQRRLPLGRVGDMTEAQAWEQVRVLVNCYNYFDDFNNRIIKKVHLKEFGKLDQFPVFGALSPNTYNVLPLFVL